MRIVIVAMLLVCIRSHAIAQCGEGAGDCYEVHPEPGCIMTECCDLVCEVDPICCEISWNEDCVIQAEKLCVGIVCPS